MKLYISRVLAQRLLNANTNIVSGMLSIFLLVITMLPGLIAQVNNDEKPHDEDLLFTFGLIADIQYADVPSAGQRNYRGALSKLRTAVPQINQLNPGFVITLGDNIDRDYKSFDKVLPLISQINAPVYNAIGNHDFSVEDQFKPLVRRRLNNPRGYFSFVQLNYRFIILDGSDWSILAYKKGSNDYNRGLVKLDQMKVAGAINARDWNGGIGPTQLGWLKEQLIMADEAGQKALLFCHWPVWPEMSTQLWNSQEVLKILSRHPSVFAWISGHHHAGGYHVHEGVHHLTLKGMVESKTSTSFGIMKVYDDRLVMQGIGDQLSVTMSPVNDLTSNTVDSSPYHNYRAGLPNAYQKFSKRKKGRVAFLGGSITQNSGWRDSVMQYLENRFPGTVFDFVTAGIASMGSTPGAFRLDRDVLSQGPVDLLFEEAAVNDATNGRSDQEQVRAMEGIVRHIKESNPSTDIVFMYFVDPDKMNSYRAGEVPEVIQNHEKVAIYYNIPVINLAKEVTDRIDAHEFTWEDDFVDLHPSPFGQGVYARSIIGFLESAWENEKNSDGQLQMNGLPPKSDPYCYDKGKLIEVNPAMEQNGWKYVRNWKPPSGGITRPNYTDVPMLIGDKADDILTFSFHGRAAGIAVAAGPDAGTVQYRIDGGDWQEQDLFTRWSSRLHLPWYYTLAAELREGDHTLEIRLKGVHNPESTGNACRIRYFYVNE